MGKSPVFFMSNANILTAAVQMDCNKYT